MITHFFWEKLSEYTGKWVNKARIISRQLFHQLMWISASKRSLWIAPLKLGVFIPLSCHLQSVKTQKFSELLCLAIRLQNAGFNQFLCKRGDFAENLFELHKSISM